MTIPSPSNGNGNGSGYTQKEMLARIEAKLDALTNRIETVTLDFAVHEAKAHHDAAKTEIEEIRDAIATSRMKLAAYAGGIAVGVFAIELAARFLK